MYVINNQASSSSLSHRRGERSRKSNPFSQIISVIEWKFEERMGIFHPVSSVKAIACKRHAYEDFGEYGTAGRVHS